MDTPNPLITPVPTAATPLPDPMIPAPVSVDSIQTQESTSFPVRSVWTWVLLIIGFLISAILTVPVGGYGTLLLINLGVFGPPEYLELATIIILLYGVVVASFVLPLIVSFIVWFSAKKLNIFLPHFLIVLFIFIVGGWLWQPVSYLLNIRQDYLADQLLIDPELNKKFVEEVASEADPKEYVKEHKNITMVLTVDALTEQTFEVEGIRGFTYTYTLNVENNGTEAIPIDGVVQMTYMNSPENIDITDREKALAIADKNMAMIYSSYRQVPIAYEWPSSLDNATLALGENSFSGTLTISNMETTGALQDLLNSPKPLDDASMMLTIDFTIDGENYDYYLPTKFQGWDTVIRGIHVQ